MALEKHICLPERENFKKKTCVCSVLTYNKMSWGAQIQVTLRWRTLLLLSSVSLQRLLQYELIFRLLLKVTVDWPRECNSIQFMRGALLP